MSGTANRLLRLMYEWLEEAEECSSDLRDLAEELEDIRENYNAVETGANTGVVVGSVLALCAAPFTGGASALALAGVYGGLGAGVSLTSKITEEIHSSSKLERVKKIDKRCRKIANEIQELYQDLRRQCPSRSAEERDKYVLKEFLKAMAIRSNLRVNDLDFVIIRVIDIALTSKSKYYALLKEVYSVYCTFSLRPEGVLLFAQVGGRALPIGVTEAKFLGCVLGVAMSLIKAIDGWEKAIKKTHETESSRSLKDAARKIERAVEDLSRNLKEIERLTRDAINGLRWR